MPRLLIKLWNLKAMINLLFVALGFGLNYVVETPTARTAVKAGAESVWSAIKSGWQKGKEFVSGEGK